MICAASAPASLPSGRSSATRIAKVRKEASYDGMSQKPAAAISVRIVVIHPARARVGVRARQRHNRAPLRQRVPSRERGVRADRAATRAFRPAETDTA